MWPWKTKTAILLEERDFLRAQVAQLQNFILMTGAIGPTFPTFEAPKFDLQVETPGPDENGMPPTGDAEADKWLNMAMSEQEEDIEWARQAGDITDARANELLTEIMRERQDEL